MNILVIYNFYQLLLWVHQFNIEFMSSLLKNKGNLHKFRNFPQEKVLCYKLVNS
jgi:hypothetical protein